MYKRQGELGGQDACLHESGQRVGEHSDQHDGEPNDDIDLYTEDVDNGEEDMMEEDFDEEECEEEEGIEEVEDEQAILLKKNGKLKNDDNLIEECVVDDAHALIDGDDAELSVRSTDELLEDELIDGDDAHALIDGDVDGEQVLDDNVGNCEQVTTHVKQVVELDDKPEPVSIIEFVRYRKHREAKIVDDMISYKDQLYTPMAWNKKLDSSLTVSLF